MRKLYLTITCEAAYTSSINVPDDMCLEEAIEYAKQHIKEVPLGVLEWIEDSDQIDEENCDFEEQSNVSSGTLYRVKILSVE